MEQKNVKQRRMSSTWRFAVFVLMLISMSNVVMGEDGRLSVDLAGASPRVRSNAPVMLLLKTYWNGSSIVEGYFEMRYYADGHMLRSECKSHDIVLSPGEQTIRLNLPTAGSNVSFSQDEVGLRFVTPDQTFDLKRYPLIFSPSERTMNICVVGPTDRAPANAAEEEVTDALRLGDLLATDLPPGSIATVQTRWDTADVPEQPLQFCSFDLVLLRPEGLADLRKKQMVALLAWARAGGSICVVLPSELTGNHVEFLNQLVAESVERPFLLDTTGGFVADAATAKDGIWRANIELGRAAVIDLNELPTDADLAWLESRKVAGFLWKLRRDRQQSLSYVSRRQVESIQSQSNPTTYRRRGVNRQLSWQPIATTSHFISHLMPEDVKVVPMSLIALLLIGYLILIGPVDYYFLGFINRRRYTWLTFPLMTVCVAFLCVGISESYLASKTTGKSLLIRDVGADGTVLRETRFELKFLSRRSEVTTEVKNEIFTPMDQERLTLNMQYAYQYQYMGQRPDVGARAKYSGRIPGSYEVHQVIPQWRPQINRSFSIALDKKVEGFAWDDERLLNNRFRQQLRQAISEKWPNAKAVVFREDHRYNIAGGAIFKKPVHRNDHRYRGFPGYAGLSQGGSFTDSLCRREPGGLFQFVSQLSPNGGDNFEDLTIVDASDRGQALLVIAVQEGDDLVMYRRLYTGLNKK